MVTICGIDEAGRGAVIGPLILAGVKLEESDISILKDLKVKDSKLLPHSKRIILDNEIKKIAKAYKILQISPQEIDNAIDYDSTLNLNWLEARKTADILNDLRPDKAIIDCPSPNILAYTNYLKKLLKFPIELIIEHKADVHHIPCSAASILAKVVREKEVSKIRLKYGDIGPGYTSNPITQKFVKENWERYPEIFRKSWSTWKNNKIAKEQKNLGEFKNL